MPKTQSTPPLDDLVDPVDDLALEIATRLTDWPIDGPQYRELYSIIQESELATRFQKPPDKEDACPEHG